MFDKKQYITDSFLKAQKYWIEKQKYSKKKINAKMALLPFLMPNLDKNLVDIAGDESDWNMNDEETLLFLSQLNKEFEDFNKDNVIMTFGKTASNPSHPNLLKNIQSTIFAKKMLM